MQGELRSSTSSIVHLQGDSQAACRSLTGDIEYAHSGTLSRVLHLEPLGLAALSVRQLLTLLRRRASTLAASVGHEAIDDELLVATNTFAHDALRLAGDSPSAQQLLARCIVAVTWLLPLWLAMLTVKMAAGFIVQRFVHWYNRHYDRTIRRMFRQRR